VLFNSSVILIVFRQTWAWSHERSKRMRVEPQYPDGIFQTFVYLAQRLREKWAKQLSVTPKVEEQPVVYFVPGQITLLVEHPQRLSSEEIVGAIQEHELLTQKRLIDVRTGISPHQVHTFRSVDPAFSLVRVDVAALRQDDKNQGGLLQLVQQINRQLSPIGDARERLIVRMVSPNWLLSCAPIDTGTGGPGAQPVPALSPGSSSVQSSGHAPWEFTLPLQVSQQAAPEVEVEVAILDTAPCFHDMAHAFALWHERHPLVAKLLGPDSPLQITHAQYSDLLQLADFELKDHRYLMSDHGLFAAGIIHSIAPYAELHLIEVLNAYGVGSIDTIARGLEKLANRTSTKPLVVNCSLVVNIPPPEELAALIARDPMWAGLDPEMLHQTSLLLQKICDTLRGQDFLVVAAAGNDAKPDKDGQVSRRPEARFPAAFESVTGVGALTPVDTPTDYSNISDTPSSIATLGGAAANGKADEKGGVLGIYIGDFPGSGLNPRIPNTNGWARWAGTSFAAPIISGALAALRGQGKTSQEALDIVFNTASTPTEIGKVFHVEQG
jgi:hypothetical protein